MGRTLVRTMKIDYKNLTISMTCASSNVRDWNDRLIYESYTHEHDTLDSFRDQVFAIADDTLSGMLKLPRNHTIEKRLQYLKDHNLLQAASTTTPDWLKVIRNDESFSILSGQKKIKCPMYIIANDSTLGVTTSKYSYSLKPKRKATKFLDKKEAQAICDQIDKQTHWVKSYGLSVQELN